ncbi:hypothetical protein GCM10009527_054350 [Actinomadura nitritigenes]
MLRFRHYCPTRDNYGLARRADLDVHYRGGLESSAEPTRFGPGDQPVTGAAAMAVRRVPPSSPAPGRHRPEAAGSVTA